MSCRSVSTGTAGRCCASSCEVSTRRRGARSCHRRCSGMASRSDDAAARACAARRLSQTARRLCDTWTDTRLYTHTTDTNSVNSKVKNSNLYSTSSWTSSLRLTTHETFVAQQKLLMCHTLLQSLATDCATKIRIATCSISLQLVAETSYADWSIRVYVCLFTSAGVYAGPPANNDRHSGRRAVEQPRSSALCVKSWKWKP